MIKIRRAEHRDAELIIKAHVRSIREICSKDYSSEQIQAWSSKNFKTSTWCQAIDRDSVWVVELHSIVQGFGHFAQMDEKQGEIMGLYFSPELKGLGAGKELFSTMLNTAKSLHLEKVQLYSTLTAKSFYERFGFSILKETSIEMQGIPITCYHMETQL